MTILLYDRGLYIENKKLKLIFDPTSNRSSHLTGTVFITHGHGDHVSNSRYLFNNVNVYLSRDSRKLIEVRSGRKFKKVTEIEAGKVVDVENVSIKAYNAGHILGSLQFRVDFPDFSLGYTGDINVEDTLLHEKCSIMEDVDYLVIESTYGSEEYVFPPRSEAYTDIVNWIEKWVLKGVPLILGGFALGKCQELLKIIQKATDVTPVVYSKVYSYSKVYVEEGVDLGRFETPSTTKSQIVVMPHLEYFKRPKSYWRRLFGFKENPKVGVFTGMVMNYKIYSKLLNEYKVDFAYPLSSHADVAGLLEYVEKANPKKVFTLYGKTVRFARLIKAKLGIEAIPLRKGFREVLDRDNI